MTREELSAQHGEDLLFLDPPEDFDRCIVGVVYRCGFEPVVCYDQDEVVNSLMLGGMDRDEALEFFDFNTAGAYVGPKTPMFLQRSSSERVDVLMEAAAVVRRAALQYRTRNDNRRPALESVAAELEEMAADDNVCTLCGRAGHRASKCPWRQEDRA